MNKLEEVLEKYGITEEDLNNDPDILFTIFKKDEFKEYLFPEILGLMFVETRIKHMSEKVQDNMHCLYLNIYLIESERVIKEIINDNDESKLSGYLKTSYPLISVVQEYFPNYKIEMDDYLLNKIFGPIKSLLDKELNKYSIPVVINYLDVFYKIQTSYFEKYGKDICNLYADSYCVKMLQNRLNENNKEEIPAINIKPESLGLLDITKLKK